MKYRLFLVPLVLPLLCSCTNLVWTSKPLITKPSDYDFRFVGEWERLPDPHFPDENRNESINVTRDEETKTKYTVKTDGERDESEFTITTSRLSDDSEYAVVQINLSADDTNPNYFYGYALRKDDNLYVWTIQSDKLVRLIKDEEINSVIDRRGWTTHITADSTRLLELVAENSRTLASENPMVYRLRQ